jgi:anhydro-N-acetylmuramic acid kinase
MILMTKIENLKGIINKTSRRIIGLMSGMSMDGVDLALVTISGSYPDLKISLEDTYYLPYTENFRNLLKKSISATPGEISRYNMLVGEVFSNCVLEFSNSNGIDLSTVDLIGSHGQTIFHNTVPGESTPSTLQIGSGPLIAERTGIITVYNFREKDVAAGGSGAPLVALVDYLLFREKGRVKAYNNLGSISNVTVVADSIEDVIAFDTGPANMPIDFFAAKVPGDQYGIDKDACYSSQGRVVNALLQELLLHEFFTLTPPKTLGFEEFGQNKLDVLASMYRKENPHDLVRTALELSAVSIADAYRNFVLPAVERLDSIIFTGGGSKNPLLMQRIQELLPSFKIESMNDTNKEFSDAKEALSFAVLANELISGRPGSYPGITGVSHPSLLGAIAL